MAQWITAREGVRYREHPTRKHGVRKDRYYVIRHRPGGKRIDEALGWASGGWTEKEAGEVLAELQKNQRRGEPPFTLKQKKEMEAEKEAEQQQAETRQQRERITFADFFNDIYFPTVQEHRKSQNSIRTEKNIFDTWLNPAVGKRPIKAIVDLDIKRIRSSMVKAGRAPRTIEYVLAICRQVFAEAIEQGYFIGKNPARGGKRAPVKRKSYDNRRMRFLNDEESAALLAALANKSQDVHDMALLSLHTGMRAGEIFALTWGRIDLAGGTIAVLDPKNAINRYAYLNIATRPIFANRQPGKPDDLVFPGKGGDQITQISKTFSRTVDKMGLNEGISDRRQQVCFHSLRHTFASRLVNNKVDIFRVKELMGHSDIKLTVRYSHLAAGELREAVNGLAG